MRGIAQNDIETYSKTRDAVNWPSDNSAATADDSGKTWKLSDDQINLLVGNAVLPSVANAIAKALRIFWHPTVWAAINRQSMPRMRWLEAEFF